MSSRTLALPAGTSKTVDIEKQEAADRQDDADADNDAARSASASIDGDPDAKGKDRYLVDTLGPEDDPKFLPSWRKWLAVLVIGSASFCATCASSISSFAESGVSRDLHVSREVSILGISLFVMGLGTGPLLAGPLSEMYGRNIIYRVSYVLFFVFSFPVAFAPHIAVYLVFRFVTGLCGAAFLSVAGGSVSDLFTNETVATPMSVYTATPFLGPVIGPILGGFINQNTSWRWTFYLIIIWTFVETILLFFLVPETYEPVLLQRKARRLRKLHGDERYHAPLDKTDTNLVHSIMVSCYRPLELIISERMVLLLDVWNSLILGILYLTFQAFPLVFAQHGFSDEMTGLTFVGIGIGIGAGLATQPYWNKMYARRAKAAAGNPAPEMRLVPGMLGGIVASVGLYWLAFTTYKSVHWVVPIIASVLFGAGIYLIFTSSWTYLVVVYRPYAASVMAGNSFMRSCFAAGFPLFATQMYRRLGTVGATALLAGLTTLMVPLPFVFYKKGAHFRSMSKFAAGAK